jgi:hypothetical protein
MNLFYKLATENMGELVKRVLHLVSSESQISMQTMNDTKGVVLARGRGEGARRDVCRHVTTLALARSLRRTFRNAKRVFDVRYTAALSGNASSKSHRSPVGVVRIRSFRIV